MAGFTETIKGIFGSSSSMLWTFGLIIVVGGIALILLLGGLSIWYFKKRWNLRVEIKLIRGGNVIGEWGKGLYDSKRGVVFIKRQGGKFKSTPMEIFDLKEYMQGDDLLTIEQVGPNDFRPVKPKSFLVQKVKYINEETGEEKEFEESVMDIKIDTGLNKAWKSSWENAAKQAYSLKSFFTQFQTPIAIGIVIISVFVGFAVIWSRLGSLCG